MDLAGREERIRLICALEEESKEKENTQADIHLGLSGENQIECSNLGALCREDEPSWLVGRQQGSTRPVESLDSTCEDRVNSTYPPRQVR